MVFYLLLSPASRRHVDRWACFLPLGTREKTCLIFPYASPKCVHKTTLPFLDSDFLLLCRYLLLCLMRVCVCCVCASSRGFNNLPRPKRKTFSHVSNRSFVLDFESAGLNPFWRSRNCNSLPGTKSVSRAVQEPFQIDPFAGWNCCA